MHPLSPAMLLVHSVAILRDTNWYLHGLAISCHLSNYMAYPSICSAIAI